MKKIIMFASIFTLILTLAACGDGNTKDPNDKQVDCAVTPDHEDCQERHDNIVLSYAEWGDQEMAQALIDAFEEQYPWIQVDLRQDIQGAGAEFTGNLINAQAAGLLPDVFVIDNVPTGVNNGLALDVAEFWDADPDTDLIYPNIQDTGLYNGKRLAMPTFQFIKGIYMNLTLFKHYNIPIPEKDWTYDEFIQISKDIRQLGKNDYVFGIDPWFGSLDFEQTFPTQDSVTTGYQTWDGEKFHFSSQAWIDAYNTKLDLYDQDVVGNYTEEELSALGVAWPWYEGLIGMNIDGSWNMGFVDQMYEDHGIEVGFWPYPGGSAGQFPPTILDFILVSSQTQHPEEAYLLAKWMSWGKQGWLTRLEVMEERGDNYLDRFPIADYPDVWTAADKYVDYVEGLRENVDLFEFSKPDVDKWLPGYKSFWDWVGNEENDYWNRIANGEVTPEVFAPEWETQLNQMVAEAMATIGLDD